MSRLSEMIKELCPNGVEYRRLGETVSICRGIRVVRAELQSEGEYPVYQNSLIPMGYYDKSNCSGRTSFIIGAGAAGEIGYSEVDFWAADDCFYFVCEENVNNRFLYHVLLGQESLIKGQVRKASIPRLSRTVVEKLLIPVPPLPIQNEIVKMLDNFTELTAELTAELQLRKKQYSFYRDSLLNFSRDDAEVEWKTLGETTKSISSGKNKIRFVDGEYPVYGSTGIIGYCTNFVYEHAQILVARVGSVGYVQIADGRYDVSDNTLIVDVLSTINMKYIFYYLGYMNLSRLAHGAGQPLITAGQLKKLIIPIPPLETQAKIVSILDRFDTLCHDLTQGLPAEIAARKKQYEYYRDKLLAFQQK